MPELAALRQDIRDILVSYCRGAMPPGLALMHLAMAAEKPEELAQMLTSRLLQGLAGFEYAVADRIDALLETARISPDAWQLVHSVLTTIDHEPPPHTDGALVVRHLAAAFDRAASVSPEGSVALYTLGCAERLDEATAEVVEFMRKLGLVRRDYALVDIGCGIGRFEVALAPQVGSVAGVEISAGMVEIARRRCAGLRNVSFHLSAGGTLSEMPPDSADCVFAIDCFPYIVQTSRSLPRKYFQDVARILKPRMDLVIINYSYRADHTADGRDLEEVSRICGYRLLRTNQRPFRLWDGRVFHLRKTR
jgi:SAM-dependent methyltransferase